LIYGTAIRVKGDEELKINSKYNNSLIRIKQVDVPSLKEKACQIKKAE